MSVFISQYQPHLKVEVRGATQRNAYQILKDRAALLVEYDGDDYMITALRQFPLCYHTSTLYRAGETPDSWEAVELTHDAFLDLNLDFLGEWINHALAESPILALQEVEYLQNFLNGGLNLTPSSTET